MPKTKQSPQEKGKLVWVRHGKASSLAHLVDNAEPRAGKVCIKWQDRRDTAYVDADQIVDDVIQEDEGDGPSRRNRRSRTTTSPDCTTQEEKPSAQEEETPIPKKCTSSHTATNITSKTKRRRSRASKTQSTGGEPFKSVPTYASKRGKRTRDYSYEFEGFDLSPRDHNRTPISQVSFAVDDDVSDMSVLTTSPSISSKASGISEKDAYQKKKKPKTRTSKTVGKKERTPSSRKAPKNPTREGKIIVTCGKRPRFHLEDDDNLSFCSQPRSRPEVVTDAQKKSRSRQRESNVSWAKKRSTKSQSIEDELTATNSSTSSLRVIKVATEKAAGSMAETKSTGSTKSESTPPPPPKHPERESEASAVLETLSYSGSPLAIKDSTSSPPQKMATTTPFQEAAVLENLSYLESPLAINETRSPPQKLAASSTLPDDKPSSPPKEATAMGASNQIPNKELQSATQASPPLKKSSPGISTCREQIEESKSLPTHRPSGESAKEAMSPSFELAILPATSLFTQDVINKKEEEVAEQSIINTTASTYREQIKSEQAPVPTHRPFGAPKVDKDGEARALELEDNSSPLRSHTLPTTAPKVDKDEEARALELEHNSTPVRSRTLPTAAPMKKRVQAEEEVDVDPELEEVEDAPTTTIEKKAKAQVEVDATAQVEEATATATPNKKKAQRQQEDEEEALSEEETTSIDSTEAHPKPKKKTGKICQDAAACLSSKEDQLGDEKTVIPEVVGAATHKRPPEFNVPENQIQSTPVVQIPLLTLAESLFLKADSPNITDIMNVLDALITQPLSRRAMKKLSTHLKTLKQNQSQMGEAMPPALEQRRCSVRIEDAAALRSLLEDTAALQNLQQLSLCRIDVDVSQLQMLSRGSAIKSLKLVHVVISDRMRAWDVSVSSLSNSSLCALHLLDCQVEEEEEEYLEDWLLGIMAETSLSDLHLESTDGISDSCIKKICQRSRQLKLVLRCMPVPHDLLGLPNVTSLTIIDCPGGDQAVASASLGPAVKEFHFWGYLSQKEATCFFQSLVETPHPSLEVLTLTVCESVDLRDLSIHKLLQHTSMRKIDLVALGGAVGVPEMPRIISALECSCIQHFGIWGKGTSDEKTADMVTKTLSNISTLQTLRLLGSEWQSENGRLVRTF